MTRRNIATLALVLLLSPLVGSQAIAFNEATTLSEPGKVLELANAEEAVGEDARAQESTEDNNRKAAANVQAALMQQALLKIYRSSLLKKTYQHVEYPETSIERNEEGDVILLLEIKRNGKVKSIGYHTKSRSHALNLAARSAVKRAKPFSAAPSALEGESFEITMPIRFRLTE